MTYDTGKRGSGRTTRALQQALKIALEGPEPRLVVFVVPANKHDDYNFRIIAKEAKEHIKQYSMASRQVLFKSGGRIRFVSWDDVHLMQFGPTQWRLAGYRPDTPVIWDHHAEDLRVENEIARNKAEVKRGGRPEKLR